LGYWPQILTLSSNQQETEKLLVTADKEYIRNNSRLSFKIYSSLANNDKTGHALFRLGLMYKYGRGIEIDNDKAKLL